jgi:hypothetical protein
MGALVGGEHANQVAVSGDVGERLNFIRKSDHVVLEKLLEPIEVTDIEVRGRLTNTDEVGGDDLVQFVERPSPHAVLEPSHERLISGPWHALSPRWY